MRDLIVALLAPLVAVGLLVIAVLSPIVYLACSAALVVASLVAVALLDRFPTDRREPRARARRPTR